MTRDTNGNLLGSGGADDLLKMLGEIPQHARAVLVIRHAERENEPTEDHNVPLEQTRKLTERGRATAREFGRRLPPFANLSLTHTPVPRARDTADAISGGFHSAHPEAKVESLGVDPTLGLSRFYARDLDRRNEWRTKLGGMPFLRAWLDGGIPEVVLPPTREVVADFTARTRTRFEKLPSSSLHIAVTHDFDLIILRDVLFNRRFETSPWIDYLDGILFRLVGSGEFIAQWRGESADCA